MTGWEEASSNIMGRSSKSTIISSKGLVFRSSLPTSIKGDTSGSSVTGWEEASRNNVGGSSKSAVVSSKGPVFRRSLSARIKAHISSRTITTRQEVPRDKMSGSHKATIISSKSLIFRLRGSVGSNCQQYTGKYLHCSSVASSQQTLSLNTRLLLEIMAALWDPPIMSLGG